MRPTRFPMITVQILRGPAGLEAYLSDTDHEDGEENDLDKVHLKDTPQDGGDVRPHLATLVPNPDDVGLHFPPQTYNYSDVYTVYRYTELFFYKYYKYWH